MRISTPAAMALGALCIYPVAAQAGQEVASLDPVVVTPTRTAETADASLAAVSVIDRKAIERRQPQTTLDLLRTEPGIDVTRNGGPGGNTSIFLRGTESNHALVLIDGVRAASGTTGQFAWQHLDPAQIERIEIVRGPRASIYGSDAIGGVIQIFTRDTDGPRARAGVGSDRTREVGVGFGGGEIVRYGLNASYKATDGFPSQTEESGGVQEDHGYRNRSVSGRVAAPVGERSTLSARGWVSLGDVEFNTGGETGFQESRNAASRIVLDQNLAPRWDHSLGVGVAEDRLDNFGPRSVEQQNRFRTERFTAEWRHDLLVTDGHRLQLGVDYVREDTVSEDRVGGTTDFDEVLSNRGVFGLWKAAYALADTEVSLRYDDNREFGDKVTGQLAIGVPLSTAWRAVASGGTAFKAPTANQLYSPGFNGMFAGNPELDPESSWSAETGLRYRDGRRGERLDVNVFYTRIDDLIAYVGEDAQAINVDEADIQGVEIEYGRSFSRWDATINGTLQRARDRGTGERLIRRADEKGSLILGYDLNERDRVTLEGVAVGSRPDRNTTLHGYGLVNLAATRELDNNLRLEARVENLFDRDYRLADTYNTQGLAVFVGVNWEPGR